MKPQAILERWLSSDAAEAPYVLTASRREQLDALVAELAARKDIEVIMLPAEETTLAIAAVRQLFTELSATTLLHRRLVIIPEAERLSAPAAAALLKHLEEPAKATRYLLTTLFPQRLLPTITSRSQRLRILDTPASAPEVPDEVQTLAKVFDAQLRTKGVSPRLKIAFMRLRDYYQIVRLRGNEKMAREVLVASSPSDEA